MIKLIIHKYLRTLFDNYTYTAKSGLARGMRRKGGLGFIPLLKKLDAEEKFLSNLNFNKKIVFDVGGWEGIFALYFSRAVGGKGKVIVFEPNPQNHKKIKYNISLNQLENVFLESYAVGSKSGNAELFFDEKVTSRGTLLAPVRANAKIGHDNQVSVPVISLDDYILQNPSNIPSFVKIDVEGFEWEVLTGMSSLLKLHKPDLWIELHDEFLPSNKQNGYSIIKLLERENYSIYHVETDTQLKTDDSTIPLNGHLYAKKDIQENIE